MHTKRIAAAPVRGPLLAAALLALAPAAVPAQGNQVQVESDMQKFSYGIGMRFGQQLRQQLVEQRLDDVDPDALTAGINDVLRGLDPRLSMDELRAAFAVVRERKVAEHQALVKSNLAAGEAFLAQNKDEEGVVSLDNGVQYRVIVAGEGDKPALSDTIRVHYIGRLTDGTEFDNSRLRGEPAELPLNGVIPGWQAVVPLMGQGAMWEVWIPASLAYGERGSPPAIGPNEVLHFDIELVEVKPGSASGG